MRGIHVSPRFLVVFIFPLMLLQCATAPKPAPEPPPEEERAPNDVGEIGALLEEMREIRQAQQSPEETGGAASRTLQERLNEGARVLAKALSNRMGIDFQERVYQMFGAPAPLKDETVMLEAVDKKGNVTEVPVVVPTRELRSLTDRNVAQKAFRLVSEDEVATEFYKKVPEPVKAGAETTFQRVYGEVDATAISMEMRLIVALKGGEWDEPEGNKPAANAIAVRGLDFKKGLLENSNKTYDDTMYVAVEKSSEPPEVFEYRMTTESSSEDRGVGRLKSKQVIYVRGKHRGTDPAYRLLGNAAPGTRVGLEGEHQITGANIHSAYTKRLIDSETPLQPNVSLGCQVVATSKSEFEKAMVKPLDRREVKRFLYTIVDDAELREFNRILSSQGAESVLVYTVAR
ncbi:MAG: hypothetical protein R6V12_04665 [Candidatus Hydrogenedentota bacterium]